jgi:hypothetical protein
MKTMLNIKKSPYGLLLLTAIALLLAFVSPPFATRDLQDMTMFSLPLEIVVWIFPLLLICFWLLYLLTRRFLYSIIITRIHILITVFATLLIVAILYLIVNPSQFAIERYELVGNAMQILVVLLACGQLAYLANVLLGLFGKKRVQ